MANIKQYTDKIRTAVYGKEVRGSLAEGMEAINTEVESNTKHVNDTVDDIKHFKDEVSKAEAIRVNSENTRIESEKARVNSENIRNTSENTRVSNENTRKTSEEVRVSSELTRNSNENTRKESEKVRVSSEAIRVNSENTRKSSEETRVNSENIRVESEKARVNSENTRNTSENTRVSNENARKSNEEIRVSSESIRNSNENTRKESEKVRVSSEAIRVNSENTRNTNENTRVSNENTRKSNEETRVNSENIRKTNEEIRVNSEKTRVANEEVRKSNESSRTNKFTEIDKQSQKLIADMQQIVNNVDDRFITKAAKRLENANFNTILTGGFYATVKNTNENNAPGPYDGRLFVIPWSFGGWVAQLFFQDGGKIFYRIAQDIKGSSWTQWERINKLTPSDIGALSNKDMYNHITFIDTRTDNQPPSYYLTNYKQQKISEFKNGNVIGIQSNESYLYGILTTVIPWGDKSGGYPIQVFLSCSSTMYMRNGKSDTEWNKWRVIYDSLNKPTANDIGALGKTEKAVDSAGLNGMGLYGGAGDTGVPCIGKDGVMEVGGMIDFHPTGTTGDYCPRLEAFNKGLRVGGAFDVAGALTLAFNTGMKSKLSNGSSDIIMYIGGDNDLHIGHSNRTIHMDSANVGVGKWTFSDRDFKAYNKRAMVAFSDADGNRLDINYENDFGWGTRINGNVYIDGVNQCISRNALWSGCFYMNQNDRPFPAKKLSQCRNGWILVWCDYDDTTGKINDYNFNYTYIHKIGTFLGKNTNIPIAYNEGDAHTTKTLYFFDDHIEGNAENDKGLKRDVILKAIYEW